MTIDDCGELTKLSSIVSAARDDPRIREPELREAVVAFYVNVGRLSSIS